jgi:tRNA-dihydrouridine synthase B
MSEEKPNPAFWVGTVPVYGDLILAPMDGYSDMPFRSVCRELGSAMSYTGFISARDVLKGSKREDKKLVYLKEERPVVFQIFDSEPDRMLEAALRLERLAPDAIDVNLGCADRRVSARGSGAGLLREPEKVAEIIYKLSRSLRVPITAKIRLGWDEHSRNYLQIARIIEENGGALVAVHGRTRHQAYLGRADWEAIAEVKQALKIPVIANGDVNSVSDIEAIHKQTACDGVMIGRGALGNPWIFSRLEREQVPREQVLEVMQRHLGRMLELYGEENGLVLFRKHASLYIKPYGLGAERREQLLTIEDPGKFIGALEEVTS